MSACAEPAQLTGFNGRHSAGRAVRQQPQVQPWLATASQQQEQLQWQAQSRQLEGLQTLNGFGRKQGAGCASPSPEGKVSNRNAECTGSATSSAAESSLSRSCSSAGPSVPPQYRTYTRSRWLDLYDGRHHGSLPPQCTCSGAAGRGQDNDRRAPVSVVTPASCGSASMSSA